MSRHRPPGRASGVATPDGPALERLSDQQRLLAVNGDRAEDWPWNLSNEEILQVFIDITAHDSGRTAKTYASRIRSSLKRSGPTDGRASRLPAPDRPPLREIVTDPGLLASLMRADRSLWSNDQVTRGYGVGVRYAYQAMISALPAPNGLSRDALRRAFAEAKELSSERRGLRLRAAGGTPRKREQRPVPQPAEIERVIGRLRLSERNHEQVTADLVALGYLTGARVGALLKLTQADLWRSPTGEVWVFVEEKARPDRRPVRASAADFLLPGDCTAPSDVSIWRIRDGRVLTYHPALRALAHGCASAGLEPFTFHRLRHAFARDIAPELGLGGVVRAGGWLSEASAETYLGRPAGEPR